MDDNFCPICLGPIEETGVTIGCNHDFCARCMMRWILQTKDSFVTCPMCRQQVDADEIVFFIPCPPINNPHEINPHEKPSDSGEKKE
ncbi:CLUMA_CG020732, isoform A [Clunio marinus]|uniref:CLUMA_CG020732, isoform A n=1 Tax=Clunio marinus TaxID=568069 RepID=A0A1J1J717_9DIPT|nr:CLUMA_CG020732, isoform A [Clunio marinus]